MCSKPVPLDSTQSPVQHKRASSFQPQNSSVHHIKSVSPTNPSVQHKKNRQFNKAIRSTHKNRQFNTKKRSVYHKKGQFNTKNLQKIALVLNWRLFNVELMGVLNWHFLCWTDDFQCWTDAFDVLNWRILGAEKKWSLCWIDVLN